MKMCNDRLLGDPEILIPTNPLVTPIQDFFDSQ